MRLRLKCFGSNLLQRSLKLTQGTTAQSNLQGKGLLRWHRNLRNFSFAGALNDITIIIWDFLPSPNHPRKKWSRSRFIPSYLKPLDTLWFTWLTTKWNSENYLLPPSSAHERTTNNDIRSSYSTPLPLQSISFITSSSNSQSRTQKKLKTFPLPGTATELTRVTVAHTNPTESHQRQRAWPTHCAKSLTNVHEYLRTDVRMYVRTCEVSRQVACRYGGM